MIDAEESVRITTALAGAMHSLLCELGSSDDPTTDEWAPVREEIQRLYKMLGPRVAALESRWISYDADYEVKQ